MIHPCSEVFSLGIICFHAHNAGYALSSVEGRVAMEFFDLSEASQAKKYMLIFILSCSVFHNISLV